MMAVKKISTSGGPVSLSSPSLLVQPPELCGQDISHLGEEQDEEEAPLPQERPLEMEASHSESSEVELLKSGDEEGSKDKRRQVSLVRRKEMIIVKWLQDNPFLYDKGHTDFKAREKKKRALK